MAASEGFTEKGPELGVEQWAGFREAGGRRRAFRIGVAEHSVRNGLKEETGWCVRANEGK